MKIFGEQLKYGIKKINSKKRKKNTETMKSFAYFLLILQMNSSGALPPVIKIGKDGVLVS